MDCTASEKLWIIDTDYSLDDQYAIGYLINKINILAITVIGANCEQKPEIIKRKIEDDLINKYDKPNIMVFSGADRPFINYQKELKDDPIFDPYNFKQTDYTPYMEIAKKESDQLHSEIKLNISNIAAVKITEFCRLHQKNLFILTLGPLTNISLAVLIDSTLSYNLGGLIIAGGSYSNMGNSGNSAEYNFRADPVAAKNVINYYKNILIISLENEEKILHDLIEDIRSDNKIDHFSPIFEVLTMHSREEEETRMRHSFLGLIAAIFIANERSDTVYLKKPTDVDIIGRYTRGALAIEKYDFVKSGKFNEVTYIEKFDLEFYRDILRCILASSPY
jgi:inosine-uridine nucleoside N-ribohydrolase